MTNILCLSTSNYFPFPTRKQNVMNRMEGCNIIYVNPAVSVIAKYKDKSAAEASKKWKEAPLRPKDNIEVYFQPPVLPFFNKKRFINRINQKKLAAYLVKILKENNFGNDFVLWCYSPTSCDVVSPLAKKLGIDEKELWKRTVYDCVDRHSAYPGLIDPKVVDGMEEDLARSCGCVFATASGLYERLKAFNSNAHFIPNGADYPLFSKAQNMKKEGVFPHFGFVGMLQQCIDCDLLAALAKKYPKGKLSLIGRSLPDVDLSMLKECPNVEFAGLLPQNELPAKIKDFDVCLNVFSDNELSKDVSPLKFYEYLATGKPVVSTPVPYQVREFSDCVYIAEDKEDFLIKCEEALSEEAGSEKYAKRIEIAKSCSWDERVRQMREILGF